MGNQGIAKVPARVQERLTWPCIRRSVGQYVSQCLTCKQVRDKQGDVRFHLKNIQNEYFNELVHYDQLKNCLSDSNNTDILVIFDHFSKFAEAMPNSYDITMRKPRLLYSYLVGYCCGNGLLDTARLRNCPQIACRSIK